MDFTVKELPKSSVFSRLDPAIPGSLIECCSPPYKTRLSVPLPPEHVEFGSPNGPGDNRGPVPHHFKCEKVVLNWAAAFDHDVEDVMCLNPVGPRTGSKKVVRRASDGAALAHRQEMKCTYEQGEGPREETYLNVTEEEDEGYFSVSCINDPNITNSTPLTQYPQLPAASSTPLQRIGELKGPRDDGHPVFSSQQAAVSALHASFSASDLCPFGGSRLKSVNLDSLNDHVRDIPNIGSPIFESSMCHHVTAKLNAVGEQLRQVTEDVRRGVTEQLDDSQANLSVNETTLDTSYEPTSPLQVKVKSVVVNPNQHIITSTTTRAAPPRPERKAACSGVKLRPEVVLECEKERYVRLVTRHINEHPKAEKRANQDAMSELLSLMSHVAEQKPGADGNKWQHPSDLTRRNYQRRFGNKTPIMSLHKWQEKNLKSHKRFAKIPKFFQRSAYP